jgi:hypothetical protein
MRLPACLLVSSRNSNAPKKPFRPEHRADVPAFRLRLRLMRFSTSEQRLAERGKADEPPQPIQRIRKAMGQPDIVDEDNLPGLRAALLPGRRRAGFAECLPAARGTSVASFARVVVGHIPVLSCLSGRMAAFAQPLALSARMQAVRQVHLTCTGAAWQHTPRNQGEMRR